MTEPLTPIQLRWSSGSCDEDEFVECKFHIVDLSEKVNELIVVINALRAELASIRALEP
jgi:hypothetical protein